jgi:hypothetical protein
VGEAAPELHSDAPGFLLNALDAGQAGIVAHGQAAGVGAQGHLFHPFEPADAVSQPVQTPPAVVALGKQKWNFYLGVQASLLPKPYHESILLSKSPIY